MGRSNSQAKLGLKKGPWTREEDQKLLDYIEKHGHGSWRCLPAKAGLERCGKSCRLRWTNYLRPDIKRGKFSTHEEKTIIRLHALLGNSDRWSAIAAHLPKRTDNEIKNYWNTRLKKRLTRMGIDPVTHKPKIINGQTKHAANLNHMAQWETARLEAEARLVRESKLLSNLHLLQKPIATAPPPCLDVLKVWRATSSSNCFFNSPTTLESPTSTLNFPNCTSPAVPLPVVSANTANDIVSTDTNLSACEVEEHKMGNLMIVHDNGGIPSFSLDYSGYNVGDAVDLAVSDYVSDEFDVTGFGEIEDTRNYWNELLNMVNSPTEVPMF